MDNSDLTAFPGENEILISDGHKFKVIDVIYNEEEKLWNIIMKSEYDEDYETMSSLAGNTTSAFGSRLF